MTECPKDERLFFKCNNCGHVFEGNRPPERCPSCEQKCTFQNVTCYTPDCGCQGPDPKLLGKP